MENPSPSQEWLRAFALAGGALASFVPMIIIIGAIEGGRQDPSGIDGDLYGTIPLFIFGAFAAFLLRRRAAWLHAALGWAAVQLTFTVMSSEHVGALAVALPLAWATVLLPLSPPVRILLALPVTWLCVFTVAIVEPGGSAWADVSGMVAALLGLVYFVAWGLTEKVRWACHTAWALALVWSATVAFLAFADLASYSDAVTYAGAAMAVLMLAAVPFGWQLVTRSLARPVAA